MNNLFNPPKDGETWKVDYIDGRGKLRTERFHLQKGATISDIKQLLKLQGAFTKEFAPEVAPDYTVKKYISFKKLH